MTRKRPKPNTKRQKKEKKCKLAQKAIGKSQKKGVTESKHDQKEKKVDQRQKCVKRNANETHKQRDKEKRETYKLTAKRCKPSRLMCFYLYKQGEC